MNEKLELAQILAQHSPEEIAKAGVESMGLHGIRVIKDLWHDYEAIPERNDTKTGPPMHASGTGAEKAISEYSNPAPQIGITEQYNEFAKRNVEEFGKMHSAMKANSDAVLAGINALTEAVKGISVKAEEPKKEEHKEEEKPAYEKKEEFGGKSASPKLATLWSELGDLEAAVAKAENEIQDINGLNSAKEHIESAERFLDQVEQHELSEMVGVKAMVAIQSGWRSLAKATKLNSYDLKGYGNQVDAQVPGDETKDASSDDMKSAEAKADFYAARVNRMRKANGLAEKKSEVVAPAVVATPEVKAEEKPEEKKEEHKEEMKAELDSFVKSTNERIKFLTDRIESVTGNKAPTMTPIFMKSQGITSDSIARTLNERILASIEAGELTEEEGDTARSITNMYQAVGKGHVSATIVANRVDAAPLAVQSFFKSMEVQN